MEREDNVSAVADGELLLDVYAGDAEHFHLFDQRLRIDNDTVADNRLHSRPKDSARYQLQYELPTTDEHGVPGIMAPLVARNDIETIREKVDHLAFSLVAPLRA